MPDFGASGSAPTLLQNTLRLQGTALSAVGRPGMENFDTTRKQWRKGGKKEAGEIYVLIHFCGMSSFLMVLTRSAWTGMSLQRKPILKGNAKSCAQTFVGIYIKGCDCHKMRHCTYIRSFKNHYGLNQDVRNRYTRSHDHPFRKQVVHSYSFVNVFLLLSFCSVILLIQQK